jgi:hypothetical protein
MGQTYGHNGTTEQMYGTMWQAYMGHNGTMSRGTGSTTCEAPVKHVHIGFVIVISHFNQLVEMGR